MKLLILLLLPVIFAQPRQAKDPNEEPFLPIYPVYPYSPKLIKRGAEPELISQVTPAELYAPKVDAKDSYSSSYGNNYQRDSYYPDYSDSYSKTESPASTYPSTYYNGEATYATINAYANSPYATYNSYPTPQYTVNPAAPSYPMSSYPYYYQPSYYYPQYFNHALFPPPPPPSSSSPLSGVEYHETSQDAPAEAENDKQNDKDNKKTNTSPKESDATQDAAGHEAGQFVDGGNYISSGSRDLDVQSSTYKVAGPHNQLEHNVPTKSNLQVPLPKTTYRVISVAGQPVGPDYPLPASYVKAQQVEQLMGQTLTKLLAQQTQQQAGQPYEASKDSTASVNDASYVNQNAYNPTAYVTISDMRSKPAVTYVINTDGTAKINEEQPSLQGSLESSSPQRTSSKNAKYSNVHYNSKPVLSSTYVPRVDRDKHHHRDSAVSSHQPVDQTGDYGRYDGSQSYVDTVGSKDQSYGAYQSQPSTYQTKDSAIVTQTPRSYSYQYSAYEAEQTQQPYSQQDKINSDDGNFGAKQYKG